jgi:hypothetical protein
MYAQFLPLQRIATLSLKTFLRSSYLFYFSKPIAERALLKAIHDQPIKSGVEIGVGTGARTLRLLEVLGWTAKEPLKYTGIDLFESRAKGTPGLTLKDAFNQLKTPNVKMQFVPGDPSQALARTANMLTNTDLLVISGDHDGDALSKAWRFVPRMLTDTSLIFLQEAPTGPEQGVYKRLTRLEVERLANGPAKKSGKKVA